jgi:hypothetical protein
MTPDIVFTLTVRVAGESQEFVLGTQQIEAVVGSASDTPEFAGLFSAAAQHPANSVRSIVASQDQLPGDAALELARDPSSNVRVRVAGSAVFRRFASEEAILKLIESDPEAAEAIAGYVERFENAEINTLCEALARHPDPTVRRALAWNSATPIKWVRKLRQDPTQDVAAGARSMMARRSHQG